MKISEFGDPEESFPNVKTVTKRVLRVPFGWSFRDHRAHAILFSNAARELVRRSPQEKRGRRRRMLLLYYYYCGGIQII